MFSILTSKIYGGVAVAILLAFIFMIVTKNAVISHQDKTLQAQSTTIANQKADIATLRGNYNVVRAGLDQCNESSANAAALATQIAQAGAAAVSQVKQAGAASTASAVRRLSNLPRDGATADEQCAQAADLLLEGAN